jgi:UrcA family protein
MNRCFAALLALLFASLTVSSACLAEPIAVATALVPYNDLDLSTPAGIKTLHRRIENAANRVCPDASGPSPAVQVDAACRADALAAARAQLPHAIAEQRLNESPVVAATELR